MFYMRQHFSQFVLASAFMLAAGCDGLKNAAHCDDVCDRYVDCIDSDISRYRCKDHCRDALDDSKRLAHAAARCADCIDDRACAEISDRCGICNEVVQSFDEGGSF